MNVLKKLILWLKVKLKIERKPEEELFYEEV